MKHTLVRSLWLVLSALSVAPGCHLPEDGDPNAVEARQQAAQAARSTIDIHRSLVVTEKAILARFPFQRVLEQLVAQSEVPGLTALALFQQWWDTQNPGPCTGVLNGYPYLCRPAPGEGGEATSNPFAGGDAEYLPIGLFNRFDAAPADGSHCGEHRIVYARRSGIADARNRNLIIFEATVPNVHPQQGLKGCQKIARFWAELSGDDDIERRAAKLERFYFEGIANVPPVVHIAHFGDNPAGVGQIRTNQFMQPAPGPLVWNLREFKLRRTCDGGGCSALEVMPVTVKTTPFGPLFAGDPDFQAHFVTMVPSLAADTLGKIDMKMLDRFNTGQGLASGSGENNYVDQFATEPGYLRSAIQTALTSIGSTLTPEQIVARAQALSCAGCHQLNANPTAPGTPDIGGGLTWPASLRFTHITERQTEPGDGDERFVISPALIDEFLPARKQVLEDFLADKPPHVNHPSDPIGGRRVH